LVYTSIPGRTIPFHHTDDWKVFLSDIPIKKIKWTTARAKPTKGTLHFTLSALSYRKQPLKVHAERMLATYHKSRTGLGMIGLKKDKLSAKHESAQEKKK
jgi:hypothetical protein